MLSTQAFVGPGFLSPRSSLGADASLLLAIGFCGMSIIVGIAARKGHGLTHHRLAFASVAVMLVYFVFYYYVRGLGAASYADRTHYDNLRYGHLFKPVFFIHFMTMVMAVFTSFYTLATGLRSAIRDGEGMKLKGVKLELSKPLWFVGLLWLLFLTWISFILVGRVHAGFQIPLMLIFAGYVLPAGIALGLHSALPFSERRHRVMGRITVFLFACLIVTSISVWSLLYVL